MLGYGVTYIRDLMIILASGSQAGASSTGAPSQSGSPETRGLVPGANNPQLTDQQRQQIQQQLLGNNNQQITPVRLWLT